MQFTTILAVLVVILTITTRAAVKENKDVKDEGDQVMQTRPATSSSQPAETVTITIVYDNYPYEKGLEAGWGFSCLISGTEKTILFDTGGNGPVLLKNMKSLKIDPRQIDLVVLSHIHGDHVGGLSSFLEKNPHVTVCVPKSFPAKFKADVKKVGAKLIEIEKTLGICKNVVSTGELGKRIREQSLVVGTGKGSVIITGCAHPGIVDIIEHAKTAGAKDVLMVMGGFHLFCESKGKIKKIISRFRELGVRYAGPCHCSGDTARKLFADEYKKHFVRLGVGKRVSVADLQ